MSAPSVPAPFPIHGYAMPDNGLLNNLLANPMISKQDGITAHAGGGQTNATALTCAINRITIAVNPADSVRLPKSSANSFVAVINDTSTAIQVFGNGTATINGIATGTGLSQPANSVVIYWTPTEGKWFSEGSVESGAFTGTFNGVVGGVTPAAGTFTTISSSGALTFTGIASGINLKQGSNGKCGTFILNGVTPVSVANTSIAITDSIIISLNTVGGTVGAQPHLATITAGTGFTVLGTALDTSTYNYAIISNLA